MRKLKWIILVVVILVLVSVLLARMSIQMLRDGSQAYLYGYPLVLMEATRQVMTDPDAGLAPVNHFAHIRGFPGHLDRQVVRPNCDTLYSTAWIDLSVEPIVLSVPNMGDRYYVLPFMDAWTNVFAYVGTRTTGSGPGNYMVVGPDWEGNLPEGVQKIQSPTNLTWLIGRIQANGQEDFITVYEFQDRITLSPLARWKKDKPNSAVSIDKRTESKTKNPKAMVAEMPPLEFFATLARLMGKQPPAVADGPILEMLAEFGIFPGKPFVIEDLGFLRRRMLTKAVEVTRKKMIEIAASFRSPENQWSEAPEILGNYGTSYTIRAGVSQIGLGALEPAEAVYPNADTDITGQLLNGGHRYKIHFDAGKYPPVNAFWSLTMYDEHGFLVENSIQRYAIGDRDPLEFNADGSLDILIQHRQPETKVSNWMPSPVGSFVVTLRLYLPKDEFLNGKWKIPPIERVK